MKKGLTGVIISLLLVLSISFAILYISAATGGSTRESDLRAVINEREQQLISMKADQAELAAQIDSKDEEISALEQKAAGLETEIEGLEASASEKQNELDSLSASLDEKYDVISSLSAENREQAGNINKLKNELAQRDAQIEELKKAAEETEQQNAGEETVPDTTPTAVPVVTPEPEPKPEPEPENTDTDKTEELTAEIKNKEAQIELLTADARSKDEQIEQLTAELSEKNQQIETMNADLYNRDGQIEALKADIVKRAGDNGKISDELSAKEEELASLSARMEELLSAQTTFDSQKLQMKQWFIETIAGASSGSNAASGTFTARFRIRSTDNPNVRTGPAATGKIVGHALASREYEVLDIAPGVWLKIRLENGKTGWISSKMGTLSDLEFSFENAEE